MTDIMTAESAKWKTRFVLYFLQKELTKIAKEHGVHIPKGKSIMDVVHDDLSSCPNQGVKKIYRKIVESGSHMKEHYQMATIIDLAPFALWLAYHDTAYRDPMFWIIDELLSDKELKKDIQEFVKDPKEWYCPVWHDSKENTKEMRDKQVITAFQLAPDEMVFCPESQIDLMHNEMEKQLRLRDRNPNE